MSLYPFANEKGSFLFSGVTGLIIERNEELDKRIDDYKLRSRPLDDQIQEVLYGEIGHESKQPLNISLSCLTILVTHDCNLRCPYCYHHDKLNKAQNLSLEVLERSMLFILKHIGFKSRVAINFFGGEPLLACGFIREACDYFREFGQKHGIVFKFSIVTNGTLISDEIIDLLLQNKIRTTVSFDGFRQLQDSLRPFQGSHQSSYDIVKTNLHEFSKLMSIGVRATLPIQEEYLDLIKLHKVIEDTGVLRLSVAPVTDKRKYSSESITAIKKRLTDFSNYALLRLRNKETVRLTNLNSRLKSIHFGRTPRHHPCSAGGSMLALSAEGSLYLCHRFITTPQYKIADTDQDVFDDRRANFLLSHDVENKMHCKACWASRYCGGGCYHSAYTTQGYTEGRDWLICAWSQELIKTALHLYTSLDTHERQSISNN
jgi:uncharacterized protein